MEGMCVDPGETRAALQPGGVRGPGPPGGQWRRIDVKEMLQNVGDGLATTSSYSYAQSTYRCALCINHHTNNYNRIAFYCNYCFRRINLR
jgi:hypothetical protein